MPTVGINCTSPTYNPLEVFLGSVHYLYICRHWLNISVTITGNAYDKVRMLSRLGFVRSDSMRRGTRVGVSKHFTCAAPPHWLEEEVVRDKLSPALGADAPRDHQVATTTFLRALSPEVRTAPGTP